MRACVRDSGISLEPSVPLRLERTNGPHLLQGCPGIRDFASRKLRARRGQRPTAESPGRGCPGAAGTPLLLLLLGGPPVRERRSPNGRTLRYRENTTPPGTRLRVTKSPAHAPAGPMRTRARSLAPP